MWPPSQPEEKNYSTSFSTSEGLMSGPPLNHSLFFFSICLFVEKVNAVNKLLIVYVGHYFPSIFIGCQTFPRLCPTMLDLFAGGRRWKHGLLKISTLPSWSLKSLSSFFHILSLRQKSPPHEQAWWKSEVMISKELAFANWKYSISRAL